MFRTIMEQLKTDPVPLGASQYQATSHHAAAAACDLNAPAPLGVTHHTNERARDEHHSPALSTGHTFHARDGARDRARGVFFVSGRCRRRVVGGVFGSSTEELNGGRHRGRK